MIEAKPYGTWKSPISSSMIVQSSVKFGNIVVDGEHLYWNEIRSEDKGRSTVICFKEGKKTNVLGQPYNARTSVHEYGGAPFTAYQGTIFFSNHSDHGLYCRDNSGNTRPIRLEKNKRYANPVYDPIRDVIYAIEEEHLSDKHVINRLVKIGTKTEILCEGDDFYSMPVLHPEGTHLAFLSWNHPNMPWDATTLNVGTLSKDGTFTSVKMIAGGNNESIFQPMWSKKGELHYVSDRSGWWNIYREDGECLCPMQAEFGKPLWVFGMENYGFLEGGQIATIYTIKGQDRLGIIDPKTKTLDPIDLPFTSYGSFKVFKNSLFFVASSPYELSVLASYNLNTKRLERIQKSKEFSIDLGDLSLPEAIEFPTENNETAFGFFYSPKNKNYRGTDAPPLIVKSHGGPSACTYPALNLEIQYWTSRGFGVLDVNYGGSTGYGRAYRERLRGKWGMIDVDDCVNGALYLANHGRIDKNRMAIKGGSAGGYTTLAALTFKDVFKAGASYYGVSDLEALANDTHKFEAYYLEGLIGPYPKEQKRYQALSPIHHTEKLSCPIIFFQGDEDKVVPPSQSEMMFKALNKRKIPTAYILFNQEQHGFRIAENIKKALDSELYFYVKVFGLLPSDALKPIVIHNLDPKS